MVGFIPYCKLDAVTLWGMSLSMGGGGGRTETEFKVKSIFGAHGSQVFHKFAIFWVVLNGLATLSREIYRKKRITKSTKWAAAKRLKWATWIKTTRVTKSKDTMKVLKGKLTERGLKGLDYAIDEMIEFNKIVLNQVLLPMKTYENRNVNGNH